MDLNGWANRYQKAIDKAEKMLLEVKDEDREKLKEIIEDTGRHHESLPEYLTHNLEQWEMKTRFEKLALENLISGAPDGYDTTESVLKFLEPADYRKIRYDFVPKGKVLAMAYWERWGGSDTEGCVSVITLDSGKQNGRR